MDEMIQLIITPGGQWVGPFQEIWDRGIAFTVGNTELLLYYGEPAPYSSGTGTRKCHFAMNILTAERGKSG